MADFLVVVGEGEPATRWFERGLQIARAQGFGDATDRLEAPGVRAATFGRLASSGPSLLRGEDGGWQILSGTSLGGDDGFVARVDGDADGQVRVTTDAVGSHHVHARRGEGTTAVAGSALWLAALDDDALDPVGCQELLSTGVIYEDRTPWASVRTLPAASTVEITANGPRHARRWWSIGALEPDSLDMDAGVGAFTDAMLAACAHARDSLDRPVSDLTAGWDSRLLTAFLLGAGVEFETTVTGPADSADVVLSQRVADELGLQHLVLPLGAPPTADEVFDAIALTDGLVNAVGYARILRVHRALSARFGASLNGSFGEVGRGYWWEILKPGLGHPGPLDAAVISRARYAANAWTPPLWPEAERIEPIAHFADVVGRIDRELGGAYPLSFRLDHTYLRMRMRSWQGRIASSTDRLWPCLSPMIAREALEALLQTRAKARVNDRLARQVLARTAPHLAALPLENGGPALPRTLWNSWRFAPQAVRFGRRATRKLLGRRTYAHTLEETAAPRLALWRSDRVRAALDPDAMALGDHVDRAALHEVLEEMRRPESKLDHAFGNLLALELGLARARELRRSTR